MTYLSADSTKNIVGHELEIIKKGYKGPKVLDLQSRLRLLGYDLGKYEIDGLFGEYTSNALKSFQQDRGLNSTGVLDDQTWQELVDAGYSMGDRLIYLKNPPFRGDDVRALQAWLKTLGFYRKNETGIFDENTHKALTDFQKELGIPVDGIAGEATIQRLINFRRIIDEKKTSNFPIVSRDYRKKDTKVKILLDYGSDINLAEESQEYYKEKAYICKGILNFCKDMLSEPGIEAVFPADIDESITMFLSDRIKFANSSGCDFIISVDLSRSIEKDAEGSSCYYFKGLKSHSVVGMELATKIQDSIVSGYTTKDCRIHGTSFSILKETDMVAVLIMPSFISNEGERIRLNESENQLRLARCITSGIRLFLSEG